MKRVSTREALILAAEKLFARQGIEVVSLREVNTAAGQRNASAAHYHFGSRDKLIAAILEYRLEPINARRMAMLAEIEKAGKTGDLHAVMGAVIYPMAHDLLAGRQSHYLRFLAQIHDAGRGGRLFTGAYTRGIRYTGVLTTRILADLPPRLLAQRQVLVTGYVVRALADREGMPRTRQAPGLRLYLSHLIDTAVAAFKAPVSPETSRLLHEREAAAKTARKSSRTEAT